MPPAQPPPDVGGLAAILRAAAPEGSTVTVTEFDSGAFDVVVRRSDGPIVVAQGLPNRPEFGVSRDIRGEELGFDTGHPFVCETYTEAVAELVAACSAPPVRQSWIRTAILRLRNQR